MGEPRQRSDEQREHRENQKEHNATKTSPMSSMRAPSPREGARNSCLKFVMCYKMQDKEERGAPDPEWLIARSRPRSKVLPHLLQEYISIDPPSPLSAETKMVIVALGRGLGLKYVACWMCGGPEGHGL